MTGMNLGRVLLGGLVAGLVVNLGETILNMVVIADAMEIMLAANNGGMAAWAMPLFITMAFAWGILFVAAYAAIRPRFGAGWQTAMIAATTLWIMGNLLPGLGNLALGIGEPATVLTASTWGFFEFNIAAILGAWVYQEAPAADAARAAQPARPLV